MEKGLESSDKKRLVRKEENGWKLWQSLEYVERSSTK